MGGEKWGGEKRRKKMRGVDLASWRLPDSAHVQRGLERVRSGSSVLASDGGRTAGFVCGLNDGTYLGLAFCQVTLARSRFVATFPGRGD